MTMASKSNSTNSGGGGKGLASSLAKTNGTVATTLHRTLRQHVESQDYDARTDGLDFLQAKNGLMLSYLVDLAVLLRCRLNNAAGDADGNENAQTKRQQKECLERLFEMKAALEKLRPLEKRMRYQIDKLLALATLGAGTFAAEGREEEDEDEKKKSGIELVDGEEDVGGEGGAKNDPLSFKPDLRGMMQMFQEDEDGANGDDDDGSESDVDDEDKSSKPKIALEKDDAPATGVYQPPRLQSVPFELDNEKAIAKERRLLAKQRDRASRSELAAVIRSQYTDAPDVEDAKGGTMLGTQSAAARKIAARDKDIGEFEEAHMLRLTMGRSEKKERKKMMREELSNLGAIASGLGHVVGEVDDAFGGEGYGARGGAEEEGGAFKTRGMRKRKVEVSDYEKSGSGGKRRSKKKGAQNSFQKSLYGGGGGGGKSQRKKR